MYHPSSLLRNPEEGLFGLEKERVTNPITTPAMRVRKSSITREASNFQKRNLTATGTAFCVKKTVIITIQNRTIILSVMPDPPF
jgi:hypothetical protein